MAKNNKNKGFSLIEIIIAIAILSVLLVPIISQFTDTMRMNRRSKEQQKVNERAQYIMEYYKEQSMSSLRHASSADFEMQSYTLIKMDGKSATDSDVVLEDEADAKKYGLEVNQITHGPKCKIYVLKDTEDGASLEYKTDVAYTVHAFQLADVEIGSRKTEYGQTVYMDDLTSSVRAIEYKKDADSAAEYFRVSYDMGIDAGIPSIKIGDDEYDFTRTNEGSYVIYDDTNTYVTAIVCHSETSRIDNPNEMNAGNVHNLDSEGVALVTGFATDFDTQAANDMYAKAMERLREADQTTWEIEMSSNDADSSYIYDKGYINGLKKLIKVTITDNELKDGTSATLDMYYQVNVDVIYECNYLNSTSLNDQFVYNAYNQKFYYSSKDKEAKAPFVYIEYQPLVTSSLNGTGGNVEYAADDYILIDSQIKDAKVYLYKPRWDYAHQYMTPADISAYSTYKDDSGNEITINAQMDNTYYMTYATASEKTILKSSTSTAEQIKNAKDAIDARQKIYYKENYPTDYTTGSFAGKTKVRIHINYAATSQDVELYTNMDSKDVDIVGTDKTKQFDLSESDIYDNYFKDRVVTYETDKDGITIEKIKETKLSVKAFDADSFKEIKDEENKEDRYYTVSVHMTPVDSTNSTIVLNGAKGEN